MIVAVMAMPALVPVSCAGKLPTRSPPAVAPSVALLEAEYSTPDAKVFALRQTDPGVPVEEILGKMGIS